MSPPFDGQVKRSFVPSASFVSLSHSSVGRPALRPRLQEELEPRHHALEGVLSPMVHVDRMLPASSQVKGATTPEPPHPPSVCLSFSMNLFWLAKVLSENLSDFSA